MKILVIGGVAAGTKAATKLKREMPEAQVQILTKSADISYAGCGLPYYVGGLIDSRAELIVNTPQQYTALTGVEVVTGCEVTAIDPQNKSVTATLNGRTATHTYDKLIIATGAVPFVPDMPGTGLPGVFCMRTPQDAVALRDYIRQNNCKTAAVAGAGFIGLEAAENLLSSGLSVTVVEADAQILPNVFDAEMASYTARQLRRAGMRIATNARVTAIDGQTHVTGIQTDAGHFAADVVVLAIGIRPATAFLAGSGIETERGLVVTDAQMRTNLPDIYAAGDCALVHNMQTGKAQWSAMGSTANLAARAMAKAIAGKDSAYGGCLGTGVVRLLPQLNAGRTGLTQTQAAALGYDVETAVCVTNDKAHYYPGSSFFAVKLIAERSSHRLLGMQVVGGGAVDKMVDIAVMGLASGMTLEGFDTLDFAYAPPFSTAIHPFVQACYVLENKLCGALDSMTPAEYAAGAACDYRVLDVQAAATIPDAAWVDLPHVDGPLAGISKEEKLLLVCTRGRRAYLLQNRLKHFGYTNTKVLEGGLTFQDVRVPRQKGALTDEQIRRVKALGCLQDKRYGDRFNVRIITRNGKLTSDEQRVVAEAADRFGSGEVTMTTRLTLEIQGVPYDQLEELMKFLNAHGLETGGTGSKVRPVVSCKGTTCQYGLCDTFALSQKLHDLFYVGYHDVALPHKFKLAVGGCPNNCVKPNLNDLGIVGQRIPAPDLSKCRGCKVCQIENACPIHAASLRAGKLVIDTDACNHCGRCIEKCPFGALNESTYGYRIYIGGRWGKRVAEGRPLSRIFASEEEVLALVERAILFFRDEGVSGERFADTIARLGFDYVEDKLLNGAIDKDAVMQKTVIGGATC